MEELLEDSKFFAEIKKMFVQLNLRLDKMDSKSNSLAEKWLDGQDVMLILHISKRSLQSLRDSGTIPYSQDKGSKKIYYKASDIEDYLIKNYKGGFKSN